MQADTGSASDVHELVSSLLHRSLPLRAAPFLPDISTLCLGVPFIPYSLLRHTNTHARAHTHTHTGRALKSVQYIVFSSSCEPRKGFWENAMRNPMSEVTHSGSVCARLCVCVRVCVSKVGQSLRVNGQDGTGAVTWRGSSCTHTHNLTQTPTHIP